MAADSPNDKRHVLGGVHEAGADLPSCRLRLQPPQLHRPPSPEFTGRAAVRWNDGLARRNEKESRHGH